MSSPPKGNSPQKSLNKAYRKLKINRTDIELFKKNLKTMGVFSAVMEGVIILIEFGQLAGEWGAFTTFCNESPTE